MNGKAVVACALCALLSGCASNQHSSMADAPRGDAVIPAEAHRHRDPALLFTTPEMRDMLAQRGLAPGFDLDDWEYGRNDVRLSVGVPPLRSFGAYRVEQYDRLYDIGGRPRAYSRTTIRSFRTGTSR